MMVKRHILFDIMTQTLEFKVTLNSSFRFLYLDYNIKPVLVILKTELAHIKKQ